VTTKSNMDLDYAVIGQTMPEILDTIVDLFVGGFRRGKMPRPLMIWGPPGMGKTMTVYAALRKIAQELGMQPGDIDMFDNLTSTLEPSDVAGVPWPVSENGENKYFENLPPSWAYFISEEYEKDQKKLDPKFKARPAIILFDDIAAAHFQTQNAFYKGVHQGMWGKYRQRKNVMLVAAGNRQQDNTGANDMPRALASRFEHAYANQTTEAWLKWADEGDIHSLVIGYIRRCTNDLNEFSVEVANREEKPYACARTWEAISDLIWENRCRPNTGDARFDKRVYGIIGRPIGTKFLGYLQNATAVVAPEDIVKNPDKAPVPNRRSLDALYATASSLEYYIKQNPKHWRAALVYALREEMLEECGVHIAYAACKLMNQLPPEERRAAFRDSKLLDQLFERYDKIIEVLEING